MIGGDVAELSRNLSVIVDVTIVERQILHSLVKVSKGLGDTISKCRTGDIEVAVDIQCLVKQLDTSQLITRKPGMVTQQVIDVDATQTVGLTQQAAAQQGVRGLILHITLTVFGLHEKVHILDSSIRGAPYAQSRIVRCPTASGNLDIRIALLVGHRIVSSIVAVVIISRQRSIGIRQKTLYGKRLLLQGLQVLLVLQRRLRQVVARAKHKGQTQRKNRIF